MSPADEVTGEEEMAVARREASSAVRGDDDIA